MKRYVMGVLSVMVVTCYMGVSLPVAVSAESVNVYPKAEESFFHSLWGKMRSIMPRRNTNGNQQVTAVIGVRGAETTETALNPHWEDDLSASPTFQSDMKAFEAASLLCEQGDAVEGVREFESLVETSAYDSVQSNGLLALAACYDRQGNSEKSLAYLKTFAKKYPKHPMSKEVLSYIK